MLAAFVVTVLAGLAINFGLHYLVAGILLNVWFLVALALADGLPARISANPWQQALAWLIGSAVWIAFTFIVWLARGRQSQPSPLPEIPDDVPPVKLTRPVVLFVLIRAVAVSIGVAVAFRSHQPNADWMPLAIVIALKPTLQQSTFRAVQRLADTILGAGIAALFLLTVGSHHALEEIVILLLGAGVSIYAVNYAIYTTAIAGAALIAMDLPHPTNLDAEGRRILFTFIGVGIAVVFMFLVSLLQKRKAASAATPQHRQPERLLELQRSPSDQDLPFGPVVAGAAGTPRVCPSDSTPHR